MTDSYSAWHFDGVSAGRRLPVLEIEGDRFYLVDGDSRTGPFAFAELTHIGTQAGTLPGTLAGKLAETEGTAEVYGLKGRDGWRLGLEGPLPPELSKLLPGKAEFGGWIDKIGLGPAALAFAVISAAVVFIVMQAPERLAPLIPASWEDNIGDAMVGDLGGRFCSTPAGSKALAKMVTALDDTAADLEVELVNSSMVNAAALPGRKVLIFDGLLQEAASPDEVAGVIGHEIGHVRKRHVMRALLRQLGLSVVLGGADGAIGTTVNGILSMSYGRGAEREADQYAIDVMTKANISPEATAQLFGRWAQKESKAGITKDGGILGYLSSHPVSAERRDLFLKATDDDRIYQPALTPAEWKALKTMCKDDKDVKGDGGLF